MCQQSNIVGRKIVVHSGLERATFGFQAYVEWDLNFYCTLLIIVTMLTLLCHACIIIVIWKYVWECASRCEHINLPISS